MLTWLAEYLAQYDSGFNVFSYITLRAILAVLTALVIAFVVGPAMIRRLSAYKLGQPVRDDGPQTHLTKAGTPTMGGALILVAIGVSTLLWGDLTNRYVWVVLGTTMAFGLIGLVDDYRKLVLQDPKGLPRAGSTCGSPWRVSRRHGFSTPLPLRRPRPSSSCPSSRTW